MVLLVPTSPPTMGLDFGLIVPALSPPPPPPLPCPKIFLNMPADAPPPAAVAAVADLHLELQPLRSAVQNMAGSWRVASDSHAGNRDGHRWSPLCCQAAAYESPASWTPDSTRTWGSARRPNSPWGSVSSARAKSLVCMPLGRWRIRMTDQELRDGHLSAIGALYTLGRKPWVRSEARSRSLRNPTEADAQPARGPGRPCLQPLAAIVLCRLDQRLSSSHCKAVAQLD